MYKLLSRQVFEKPISNLKLATYLNNFLKNEKFSFIYELRQVSELFDQYSA